MGAEVQVRSMPGTFIGNPATGERSYTPPQGKENILNHLRQWEQFLHFYKHQSVGFVLPVRESDKEVSVRLYPVDATMCNKNTAKIMESIEQDIEGEYKKAKSVLEEHLILKARTSTEGSHDCGAETEGPGMGFPEPLPRTISRGFSALRHLRCRSGRGGGRWRIERGRM